MRRPWPAGVCWCQKQTNKQTKNVSAIYTGCPRRNVSEFGRVFLMLNYTDIIQNTYVQTWTVTEIKAREKCGLLAGPGTVPVCCQVLSMFVLECGVRLRKVSSHQPYTRMHSQPCYVSACHACVMYSAWNPKDNYDVSAGFFVVQFNGFMSLTS